MKYTVLAVDDDPIQLELIETACAALQEPSISFLKAETLAEGIDFCNQGAVDLVFTDHFLPDGTGLHLVDHMQVLNPEIPVIVITAYESVDSAVEFLKHGADDYVVKPFSGTDIQHVVVRCSQRRQEQREAETLHTAIENEHTGSVILKSLSGKMRRMTSILGRAAAGSATILLEGESGTGKEVLARAVHNAGPRKDGPFVVVNCAALPESLIEAELFGSRKGAYTGATENRIGRFQEADGGTLLIDEVGEIPLSVQVKLLRALQFKEIEPVGSNTSIRFDARIIAATNRNLKEMVARGEFREDLFYRLRVIGVEVPPLRDRKEDIPVLLEGFLQRFAKENGKAIEGLSHEARRCFLRYDYPGNIRELENSAESAVVLARGTVIKECDLPSYMQVDVSSCADDGTHRLQRPDTETDRDSGAVLDARLRELERTLISSALEETGHNQSAAARILGISERRLRSRLERLGLKEQS